MNLIQSYFTELAHDEAYYWVYSEYLAVGYFDHPPMIAFMIKLGYLLFQNELGVRLITVFLGSATLLVLDELTGKKNFLLIFSIYIAFTCFHVYGFIATPDAPLLFFSALFFLAYKRYLKKDSIKQVFFLSITIALLLYSKYHGILILIFVLLSNLKLLAKRSFYSIIGISILLFIPHIIWQINHDYPSYQYHVQNRNQMPYKPMDTINYLLGLILIVSPLLFPLVIKSLLSFIKAPGGSSSLFKSDFKRSFFFVIIGFTGFFLITTLNTRAEANWNIPILIPLAVILFWYCYENSKAKKWLYRLSGITVLLFAIVRLHLMIDLVPSSIKIKDEFHLNRAWSEEVEEIAKGVPVVWSNSYQNASKHYFYSKNPSHSHNNAQYRRNQFDLWPIVDSLQGQKVLFIANWDSDNLDTASTSKETLRYMFIDPYYTMNSVKIEITEASIKATKGSVIKLPLTIINNSDNPIHFGEEDLGKSLLVASVSRNQRYYSMSYLDELRGKTLNDKMELTISINAPDEPGKYYFRVNIKTGILPETINGDLIRLDVTEE